LLALVAALQPGEDAVAALRRLGATRPPPASSPAPAPAASLPPLPAESAQQLAAITSACDSLMAGGLLQAYSTPRERLVQLAAEAGGGDGDDQEMAAADEPAASTGAAAAPLPPPPPPPPRPPSAVLAGFEPSATTPGRRENRELGYVYDQATGLFGDAATGRWFRRDAATGAFAPAD